MTAVVKCKRHEIGPDGVLVVDRVQVAANYVPEEDEEVFVFWGDDDDGPEKARLAIRGVLLTFTLLERAPPRHREASLKIRVTERSPGQELLINNLHEDSEIAAEDTLYHKIKKRRHRIARFDGPQPDYLRDEFRDPQNCNELEAEEAYPSDSTVVFRSRNQEIIASRKAIDNYRCQACYCRLELQGKYIVDCHHKPPFAGTAGVRFTKLDDLMCLCPTCPRIAHSRKSPLTLEEIRAARQHGGLL